MGIEEILASIEKLNENDREKVIGLIKQKYNLINDLPREAFVASSSYEFWLNSDDDVYMK
ncbi:hypothetical protein K2F43_08375 [Clostridium estertheticum]|uniref:hypothetical protein n=1 Tax=Clostridium estertheticum TaxID=238834 RepID=UPI001C6E2254|nr:hypothetical protein [Clostridium estertheticum]MBW9171220.1 hypothetical protein [Clostridium estertheticum]WLC73923.1 hypothetical protein KTC99_14165 [Clostridium estertheticum]